MMPHNHEMIDCHEWCCRSCRYFIRLTVGPLEPNTIVCDGCKKDSLEYCPLEYRGIVTVARSLLGFSDFGETETVPGVASSVPADLVTK